MNIIGDEDTRMGKLPDKVLRCKFSDARGVGSAAAEHEQVQASPISSDLMHQKVEAATMDDPDRSVHSCCSDELVSGTDTSSCQTLIASVHNDDSQGREKDRCREKNSMDVHGGRDDMSNPKWTLSVTGIARPKSAVPIAVPTIGLPSHIGDSSGFSTSRSARRPHSNSSRPSSARSLHSGSSKVLQFFSPRTNLEKIPRGPWACPNTPGPGAYNIQDPLPNYAGRSTQNLPR